MVETTNQIEQELHSTRQKLGSNLHELEGKVKSAMDWHSYFEKYPVTMLGMAVGGGVLLAALVGGKPANRAQTLSARLAEDPPMVASHLRDFPKQRSETMDKVSETIETVKGALLGMAAMKVRDLLSDAIPGFQQHFDQAHRETAARSLHTRPLESRSTM